VSDLDVEVHAIDPGVEETGATFEENARIKALAAHAQTKAIALADDSGLEVDALGGEPGVRSARWALVVGDARANNALLVEKLRSRKPPYFGRFRCVLVLAGRGDPIVTTGACEGEIILEPRGENGFGYDPHFVPRGETRTMAELSSAEKNRISHRARALAAMRPVLESIFR